MLASLFPQQPCCSGTSRCMLQQLPVHLRPHVERLGRRARLQVVAVGWDPEGLLAAPKGGHIGRRMLNRQAQDNEELKEQMDKAREEARQELSAQREAREQPTTHAEVVEYLLSTEGDEMQFEVARTRPLLTPELFDYLREQTSAQKFAVNPNQERVDELEALQAFLVDAVKALDEVTAKAMAPAEKLRSLLQAPDKRKALLDMASRNEIDQTLLDLLNQNIEAAKASGQEKPADFMQKVHDAARKYLITV